MNSSLEIETGALSLNKIGEELCGDHLERLKSPDGSLTLVLADGLGSGVKANILSTLTSSMLSTMMEGGLSLEEAVNSLIRTLPVAKDRGNVAYSTFTIVKITPSFHLSVYNYDNPEPIFLHDGKETPLDYELLVVSGKKIFHAEKDLQAQDLLCLYSDGALYAGVGESLNFGWGRSAIASYLEGLYNQETSSKNLATLLLDHCSVLYNNRPGDDTSFAMLRLRERKCANWMVGPATNPDDDKKMMALFFGKKGSHLISGGTSAQVASRYLHEKIETSLDYIDRDVPPISKIKGVDLVTEGVITLNRLVEVGKDYLSANKGYFNWSYQQDGVSLLAKALFEEATDIDINVGCAVNPAHQDPRYNITISTKMQLVEELAKELKAMDKHVKISYF
jgi:hypothetical protein